MSSSPEIHARVSGAISNFMQALCSYVFFFFFYSDGESELFAESSRIPDEFLLSIPLSPDTHIK